MTLKEVADELRGISGKPYRDEADRSRRMYLWWKLDQLVRVEENRKLKPERFK